MQKSNLQAIFVGKAIAFTSKLTCFIFIEVHTLPTVLFLLLDVSCLAFKMEKCFCVL